MGKGKGAPSILLQLLNLESSFEVSGVPVALLREALRLAAQEVTCTTKFIIARDFKDIMKISEIRNMTIDELNEN
ncbi:MAG: hypothetical protein CM15mP102_12340 [Flavobacteriales bacterium]|nr:MAG: hypothetical protein CM15mP102_12340 [Flavobacteriales bacterium]